MLCVSRMPHLYLDEDADLVRRNGRKRDGMPECGRGEQSVALFW
jgi:hypothetical protein